MKIKIERMPSKEQLQEVIDELNEMYEHESEIVNDTSLNMPTQYLTGHNGMHGAYFNVLTRLSELVSFPDYKCEVSEDG